jgi:glutamyl-tRNA reductase
VRLVLVGTSHKSAPVELRERLHLKDPEAGALAAAIADGGEAVALSTCNRTEVYVAGEGGGAHQRALEALSGRAGLDPAQLRESTYAVEDEAAALHLFRVAAGLDSLIPGEAQILGQVRAAYEAACEADAVGPTLHRLFGQALRVGRRVRTETAIAENPASISSAAAQLAESLLGDLRRRRVLVVGAGKMADLAAVNLVARGAESLVVANRSPESALRLAERFGGRAVGVDGLPAELEQADVVVASTSSEGQVLTAADVARALTRRDGRQLFFIDIAVPRDLDPAIGELAGCHLYDIDDLQSVVDASVASRREEAVRAELIVAEEGERFLEWWRSLDVVPAIASLRARAESIRRAELERAAGRLASLSPSERRAVEALTSQIVAKLLHLPTVRMKEAAAAADGLAYAEAVRHLFDLEDESSSMPGGRGAGPARDAGK